MNTVAEIMSKNLTTLHPEHDLRSAEALLKLVPRFSDFDRLKWRQQRDVGPG